MRKLSIIVPCYNERASVEELLTRVLEASLPEGWEREVIVVDDASTDGTREVLASLALPVRVLYRKENGGKGSAVAEGIKEARGDYLLIQDADLEYDPMDIQKLLAKVNEGAQVVYGSRNLSGKRGGARILQAGVWVITRLINLLYGTTLTDALTCYKLFPREVGHLFPHGGFEADMLLAPALVRAGYHIVEVPISYVPRTQAAGKKIKYRDGFRAIWAILEDYVRH